MGVSIRLENNGDVLEITNYLPVGYLKEIGAKGFGVAPTVLSIKEGAGPGGRWRNTRRSIRDITLPIIIFGAGHQDIEDKMRRLIRILNDDASTAVLIVEYENGTEYEIEVHFASGADPQYGSDTNGKDWARWPLTLRAPKPYWVSREAVTYSLGPAIAGRGLLPRLSNLKLSSSQAIGSLTVENNGDVPAFPVWVVYGPGYNFSATLPDGSGFIYEGTLLTGETVTIDCVAKTVVDGTGANKYMNLAPSPKLFSIPQGTAEVDVLLEGATAGVSKVTMYFREMKELVF